MHADRQHVRRPQEQLCTPDAADRSQSDEATEREEHQLTAGHRDQLAAEEPRGDVQVLPEPGDRAARCRTHLGLCHARDRGGHSTAAPAQHDRQHRVRPHDDDDCDQEGHRDRRDKVVDDGFLASTAREHHVAPRVLEEEPGQGECQGAEGDAEHASDQGGDGEAYDRPGNADDESDARRLGRASPELAGFACPEPDGERLGRESASDIEREEIDGKCDAEGSELGRGDQPGDDDPEPEVGEAHESLVDDGPARAAHQPNRWDVEPATDPPGRVGRFCHRLGRLTGCACPVAEMS